MVFPFFSAVLHLQIRDLEIGPPIATPNTLRIDRVAIKGAGGRGGCAMKAEGWGGGGIKVSKLCGLVQGRLKGRELVLRRPTHLVVLHGAQQCMIPGECVCVVACFL